MTVVRAQAPFYWPLRGSIVPQNGSGSPTFTRATAKWMFNDEGKLIKLPSGAIEMRGYRPVVNWFTDPNNISGSASWATSNVSKASATGPDGVTSDGCLITCTSNTSNYVRQSYSSGNLGGDTRTYRFLYKPGTAGWLRVVFYAGSTDRVSLWFNATTNVLGTVSTGGSGWTSVSYGLTASTQYPGWYEVYMIATTPTTGTHYMLMGFVDADNSINTTAVNGLTLTIAHPMLEDSTGRTDKTPSEYVAGDNGAGANGVKYYATHKDGTDIADADYRGVGLNPNQIINTLLYCRDLLSGALAGKWIPSTVGSNLVTNGNFDVDASGWSAFNCTLSVSSGQCTLTASGDNPYMSMAMATVVGKLYVVSCDVITDSMTGNNFIKVGSIVGSGNIGSLVTVVGASKFCFVATGTTTYISFSGGTGVSGQTIVVDNITCYESAVLIALNQTGIDNQANSSSLLTATADNATISQTITAAAAAASSGFYVKRSVGSGSVYFTRDGGTNWTDITSSINSTDFILVKIENTSVTNPQVGFKIATSGDAIIVDHGINHTGTQIADPIETSGTAVTVNAEVLTMPTAGNFSDTAGTILATVTRDDWSAGNGSVVGSATRGLYTSSSNSGAQGLDGTNTVNGPNGTPSGTEKTGIRWSGSSLQAFAEGSFGSAGSYDGAFNLTSIAALAGAKGAIKDISIWPSSLADADMINAANNLYAQKALDAFLLAGKDPASLKFHTHFNDLTIGTVTRNGFCRASLTGTDGLTGYDCVTDIQSFFDSFAILEIGYYPEDFSLLPADGSPAPSVASQLEATIETSSLSSVPNAKDLVFDYKYRATTPGSTSYPQIWLQVYRVGAANRSDVEEIYERFVMILPSDLKSRMVLGGNNYFAFFDYKTDGYLSQGYGDLRLIGQIYKWSVDGNLYLDFRIDNNANGIGAVPEVSTSLQTYQSIQFSEANIPLGVPLLFESYVRRPVKSDVRSSQKESGASLEYYERDLVSGVWKTCYTDLNTGDFYPLANFQGGVQMGAANLPFGRLFRGMYTPGTPPMEFRISDWQVWDRIPAHSRLRSM